MKDVEYAEEWEKLHPERELMRTLVEARAFKNIAPKDFAGITGIDQADISKIENDLRNSQHYSSSKTCRWNGERISRYSSFRNNSS